MVYSAINKFLNSIPQTVYVKVLCDTTEDAGTIHQYFSITY